jgi:DNA-directed RNA polymerase subunit M/transcription elongation factor TFIIS
MTSIDISKYKSPYNYKNYNFVTKKAIDLKNEWIKYADNEIERAEATCLINNELRDIHKSVSIEFSIFEFSLVYCKDNNYDITFVPDVYLDKLNFIISNIRKDDKINNTSFKKSILSNTINLRYIAFLSPYQVHPDKWHMYIAKIKLEEDREDDIEYSDIYKCRKCGESKSRVTQKQTRCADEPPTTFVKCLVCGNGFKFC